MRHRDTSDVFFSLLAVLADAIAVYAGFMIAVWVRFDSGWIPLFHDRPPLNLYTFYGVCGLVATVLFLVLFKFMGLFIRPQIGVFSDKIPRLARGIGLGILFSTAIAFAIRTEPPLSRVTVALALVTIFLFLLIERYILFRMEIHHARHSDSRNKLVIIGTDEIALRLARTIRREPRLRTAVIGFLSTDDQPAHPDIKPAHILGTMDDLDRLVLSQQVDQVILAHSRLGHQRIVDLVLWCEKNMVTFNMVPDLFRILLSTMDMQMVDDIPLLCVSRWPLDYFWNRMLKRLEDIAGSALGLVITAPVMAIAALSIKRTSPGPVFYRQIRCGEKGKLFTLYKLRTMRVDAEVETGPVWTVENDPRRTPVGALLRKLNIDELPQLWNVFRGEMSLVGPRPERPAFVEQFKEDISRYMWRHVSKPGITGWAQVNGLRGNTSIEERIRYDLYYLENWSLSFDFKIIIKTCVANKNAY